MEMNSMETLKPFLQDILNNSPSRNNLFKRNLVKEYLQVMTLHFLYAHPQYNQLAFYGGSCLKHLFGLPRLSEDLDFVDLKKNINLQKLSADIDQHFKNTDLPLKTKIQKFRITLKFPILQELRLSEPHETDLLFVKLEIFKRFDCCTHYQTQFMPLFKFNKSILVRTFDLPTLMATKLNAILHRQWQKTSTKGETIIAVKGRDYFDLMWYLEKGVQPNLSCLIDIQNPKDLKEKLLSTIERVDARSITLDLEPLIEDPSFAKKLSQNIKDILKNQIIQNM
jgi:hypothetical protein